MARLVSKRTIQMFLCNQGTKIGIPKVFRRIPENTENTNICGLPRNSDSYPPNTLAIRGYKKKAV
jgi:hypothetical protein